MILSSLPTSSQPDHTTSIPPRRRVARACDTCHTRRARCSGETPSCKRCLEQNLSCTYSLSVRQYRAKERDHKYSDRSYDQDSETGAGIVERGTAVTIGESATSPSSSTQDNVDEYDSKWGVSFGLLTHS